MKGPAGFDVAHRQARIYGTGNNPLSWAPLPTIAQAATNMLLNPSRILNRAIYINPIPNLTQNHILAALESVTGENFTTTHVDVALINRNSRIALERGEVAKAMRGLIISTQFYEDDSGNDLSALAENATVGVKEMSVEQAVKDAIEAYGENTPIVEGMYRVDPCEV